MDDWVQHGCVDSHDALKLRSSPVIFFKAGQRRLPRVIFCSIRRNSYYQRRWTGLRYRGAFMGKNALLRGFKKKSYRKALTFPRGSIFPRSTIH